METKSVLDKNLLSPLEVASLLSIPSKKVLSLCKSGELPCFRFGDQIRIDESDLAAYMEKAKQSSSAYCFRSGSFQWVSLPNLPNLSGTDQGVGV